MKKIIMAASLGVIVFGAAYEARAEVSTKSKPGQTAKASPLVRESSYDPDIDFSRFTKDLTLTEEQQTRIKPILAKLTDELLPLRKLTFQRLGVKGAPIVRKHYDKLREELKPEQLEIFNNLTGKGVITPFIR